MIELWNLHKMLWSLVLFLTFGMVQPQSTVPAMESPQAASDYIQKNCVYTGDLLGGVVDLVISPTRLQAAMEMGTTTSLNVDCDDYAAWAFAAIRAMGGTPTLYTLKDGSGKFGHHVVCAYTWQGEYGVIDTNGHNLLPNVSPSTLCVTFTAIYHERGYRYTDAVVTACPF